MVFTNRSLAFNPTLLLSGMTEFLIRSEPACPTSAQDIVLETVVTYEDEIIAGEPAPGYPVEIEDQPARFPSSQ